jgi:hypothetical protein
LLLPGELFRIRAGIGALVAFAGVVVIFSEDLAKIGGPKTELAAAVFMLSPAGLVAFQRVRQEMGIGHPPDLARGDADGAIDPRDGGVALLFERHRPIVWTPTSIGSWPTSPCAARP